MKKIKTVTTWSSAGDRITISYCDVNENGIVESDNNYVNRFVMDNEALTHIKALQEYAQKLIDTDTSSAKS